MSFNFREAKREGVSLIVGLAGGTGSGKTLSALKLAKGMSEGAPFAFIDTESGRGLFYADRFAFKYGDLKPPFRPDAYAEAIKAADDAKFHVVIVDSFSHSWAGEGGVLDWQEDELDRMAGQDWKKREACKMAAWIKPKMSMKAMVQRLLQVRAHLIICLRAEQRIEMVRGADGKMEIREKQSLTGLNGWIPVCEKSLPFEMTASLLLTADRPGIPQPIKLMDAHRPFFPIDQPISEDSGARLAAWAKGGAAPETPSVDWLAKINAATNEKDLREVGMALQAARGSMTAATVKSFRAAYEARVKSLKEPAAANTPVTAGDLQWRR